MKKVVSVYKPVGLSPLQTILLFKQKYPEYKNEKISYAGRLDPMAEGLLLLLIEEENKNRKQYENLPKTYEFSILLGISTDTYDILGKVVHPFENPKSEVRNSKHLDLLYLENSKIVSDFDIRYLNFIKQIIISLLGTHLQPYPPYSSKTVQGKPLYWWARQGKLNEIKIPEKEIEIFDIKILSEEQIAKKDLQNLVYKRINKVHGDFRQEKILQNWDTFFEENKQQMFPVLNCKINCSSGTYVRSLANEIGNRLGTGGLALMIKRTNIDGYSIKDAIPL